MLLAVLINQLRIDGVDSKVGWMRFCGIYPWSWWPPKMACVLKSSLCWDLYKFCLIIWLWVCVMYTMASVGCCFHLCILCWIRWILILEYVCAASVKYYFYDRSFYFFKENFFQPPPIENVRFFFFLGNVFLLFMHFVRKKYCKWRVILVVPRMGFLLDKLCSCESLNLIRTLVCSNACN